MIIQEKSLLKNSWNYFKKGEEMEIVIILSGGMDSITLLHDLHNEGHKLSALSFNYGQKHKKELLYAEKACNKFNIDWKLVDLSSITPLISNSALTSKIKVPEGHYEDKSMKITVVPNRNMIMLAIAVGYAENLRCEAVVFANHSGDHAIYPDCRKSFVSALNKASQLGTYNKIQVLSPYANLDKKDIALRGLHLGIDYDKETWSCYKGNLKHCGKCGTCVERIEAIKWAYNHIE